jgi:hypothetical protein
VFIIATHHAARPRSSNRYEFVRISAMFRAMALIFDGNDVRARFSPGAAGHDLIVVTFTGRNQAQSLDRPAFGEGFLARAGIPAIHLTVAWNHWYTVPEMAAALAVVREAAAPFARRVAYGSSMGGYGALLNARAIGATRVVAISPRFSMDPAKSPFDRQNREEAPRLDLSADDMAGALPCDAALYLLSDTSHLDGRHVAQIRAASAGHARTLALPFAGHPAGPFLQEAGLLRDTIRALLLEPEPDLAVLRAQVRRRRTASPTYWELMARCALREGRDALALRAATEAAARAPDRAGCAIALADALWRGGRHDAAFAELRRAVTLAEPDAAARAALDGSCQAAAGPRAALEAALRHAPKAVGLGRLLGLTVRQRDRRRPARLAA